MNCISGPGCPVSCFTDVHFCIEVNGIGPHWVTWDFCRPFISWPLEKEKCCALILAVQYPVLMIHGWDTKWGEIKCVRGRVSERVSERHGGSWLHFPTFDSMSWSKELAGVTQITPAPPPPLECAADTSMAWCNSQPAVRQPLIRRQNQVLAPHGEDISAAVRVIVITALEPQHSHLKLEPPAKSIVEKRPEGD